MLEDANKKIHLTRRVEAHVVVSVIGGGAFNNPPDEVAAALFRALDTPYSTTSRLRHVHIVVLDDHNSGGRNVQAMEDAYKSSRFA